MSKFLDLTGLGKLVENVKGELDTKVDKVTGKGLSANDFTDAYKNKLDGIAEGANKYTHPDSGVAAGTYRSVTVNKQGHVTAGTNPTTLDGYGITEVEAEKITGTINIANLPQGALERCVVVADDEARFKLTTANVQVGDTVKVTDTNTMYFVKDDTKLSSEEGYEVYTAGSATSVPWSGVTGKPESFVPGEHTHTKAEITDFPASMKNPNALTVKVGDVTSTYDGSKAVTVTVEAITEEEIDGLFV